MSELGPRVPVTDKFKAQGIAALSRLCVKYPDAIGRRIVGENPVLWMATRTPLAYADLKKVDGNPKAGRRPVDYPEAAVFSVPAQQIRDRVEHVQGVPAGAFAVGEAVVASLVPMPDPEAEDLQVAMRVGRDDLVGGIGVYISGANRFSTYQLHTDVIAQNVPVGQVQQEYPNAVLL